MTFQRANISHNKRTFAAYASRFAGLTDTLDIF